MASIPAARRAGGITGRQQATLSRLGGYLLMLLIVVIIGAPLYWVVTGSLKTTAEINTFPPVWIPPHPRWQNYVDAWNAAPFGRFYVNTIIITSIATIVKTGNALLTAYALAFLRFPFKNLIFIIILAGLMIPEQVTVLPNYLTLADVHGHSWINTYQGILLPGLATAYATFLLRQGFLGLPREVLDAAKVDGCSHLRMLWDMVVPMSRPLLVTIVLLTVVQRWNDFLWPLIVTTDNKVRPLTVGITYLFNNEGNNQWGVIMAGTIFVIVPLLVIFLFSQKYIIAGITAGATKG